MGINQNIIRQPAEKLDEICNEMWGKINSVNRDLVEEYLSVNTQLSPSTIKVYVSALRQFFWFVHTDLRDKEFYNISKRDFIRYMSYMHERGLSSSAINLRKSAVSSFCNYIENVVSDDMEECKSFRNFTRGMPAIAKNQVYEKTPITYEEYLKIMEVLEEKNDYLGLAWVAVAFNVGSRRAEIIQFKTEILNYPIPEGKNYIVSHSIRGKGSGQDGKPLEFMFPLEVLDYIRPWVENRGYESEFIFTTKHGGEVRPISINWANRFCSEVLSPILKRRIHPHMFKASCVTHLLERGKDLQVVSRYIAQHSDSSTTSNFYDLRDFEDEKNDIFDF